MNGEKEIIRASMEEGGVLQMELRGRFGYAMGIQLRQLWEAHPDASEYRIDLSQVSMIESSALGMLMLMRQQVGGENANIILVGANDDVMWALKTALFDRLFTLQ
ncbi:MAG: STAS domain-containing protein [Magnetococcales bacterium]|nr:STAS domain-containing protein [Magnetococcales bacterium]